MAPAVRAESAAQSTLIVGGNEGKCPDLPGPAKRTLFVPSVEPVKENPIANLIADSNIITAALKVKEERSQALMDICFKTLELSAKNRQLQKDLDELREQTRKFVESVQANPRAPEVVTTATSSTHPLLSATRLPTVQQPATFLSPMLLNLAYMSPTLYNPFLLKSLGVSNGQIASGIIQAKSTDGPVPHVSAFAAVTANKTKEDCCSVINNNNNNNNNSNNNNNNSNTTQGPLCSCCSEDQYEANLAYYAQMNGMAQNWINSLIIRGSKPTTKSIEKGPKLLQQNGKKRPGELNVFNGANKRLKSSTTHSLFGSISPSNNDNASLPSNDDDDDASSPPNSGPTSPISSLGISSPPLFRSGADPFIRGMDSGDDGDDDFSRQKLFESSEDEQDDKS